MIRTCHGQPLDRFAPIVACGPPVIGQPGAALARATTLLCFCYLFCICSGIRDRHASVTVSVTVSGRPDVMAILQANQIRAVVNLTGIESGKEKHRRVDVSTPPGVTLVDVTPPDVDVIVPSAAK